MGELQCAFRMIELKGHFAKAKEEAGESARVKCASKVPLTQTTALSNVECAVKSGQIEADERPRSALLSRTLSTRGRGTTYAKRSPSARCMAEITVETGISESKRRRSSLATRLCSAAGKVRERPPVEGFEVHEPPTRTISGLA